LLLNGRLRSLKRGSGSEIRSRRLCEQTHWRDGQQLSRLKRLVAELREPLAVQSTQEGTTTGRHVKNPQ
jgi:hypothetical protein